MIQHVACSPEGHDGCTKAVDVAIVRLDKIPYAAHVCPDIVSKSGPTNNVASDVPLRFKLRAAGNEAASR